MKKMSVKTIVAIGIGAAVFFVLGRFVAIPSPVPNTSINIQYSVLAVFAALYGPIAGVLIGFIGHTLIDATSYGPWWSWITASSIFGLLAGFADKKLTIENGEFDTKDTIYFNVVQIIAHVVAWIGIAPTLDIIIYAEPLEKVYLQGAVACISNIITTGIVGTLLLKAYAKTRIKSNSLTKE